MADCEMRGHPEHMTTGAIGQAIPWRTTPGGDPLKPREEQQEGKEEEQEEEEKEEVGRS